MYDSKAEIIAALNKLSDQARYAKFAELLSILTYFALDLDRLHNQLAAIDSKYDWKVTNLEKHSQPPHTNN